MGAWGAGIFDNDVAEDVKDEYIRKLKTNNTGKSDEQILSEFLSGNADFINDDEDMIDFWFGLSSLMYDYGRLTDDVKQKVLAIIERGLDLERWEESRNYKERIRNIEKLKTKLLSPLPKYRKVAVLKPWVCPWEENDVFLYKLDEATYDKISKSYLYVLLIVKDIIESNMTSYLVTDLTPRTYLKLSNTIPSSLDDINSAIFLPQWKRYPGNINEWRYLCAWPKQGFKSTQKLLSFIVSVKLHSAYPSPPHHDKMSSKYSLTK